MIGIYIIVLQERGCIKSVRWGGFDKSVQIFTTLT